jgi:membrane dipeptidase
VSTHPLPPIPFFDGHNDTAQRLREYIPPDSSADAHAPIDFLAHNSTGHLDLPRARLGHLQGGIFALFAPSPSSPSDLTHTPSGYHVRMARPLLPTHAAAAIRRQLSGLQSLIARASGQLRLCTTVPQLQQSFASDTFAILLHMEGADALTPDAPPHTGPDSALTLEQLYTQGLRSLGIVWSRPNAYGHGVPFAYPQSPDIGPGLTDAGKALVRNCNRLGVLIDCAHLNERGFLDVAAISHAPLVVSHACAHSITPSARNLSSRQLDAIRDTDGLVGVNLAVHDVRPDGDRNPDTPLTLVADQFARLVDHLGEDRVALGSDFDGATIPNAIGDASGLQRLAAALHARGFNHATLRKLARDNWLRVLGLTL